MTNSNNFNNINLIPKILICPLDWGLGHASRCIPIIKELISLGCLVQLAADGKSYDLLISEFPGLKIHRLPGYNVQYAINKKNLKWRLIAQVPHILKTIYKENRWLKNFIKNDKIDVVISDNRFGLFNQNIKSIFITHQLLIKAGNKYSEKIGQLINYAIINNFDQCWIPDAATNGLGGELSHPVQLPKNYQYLGPVSRFEKFVSEIKYDKLIILSGPEPQRTILEKIILHHAQNFNGNNLLIRGVSEPPDFTIPPNLEVLGLVSSRNLNQFICQSKIILSRAGYSTIMDLAKIKSKAILIPTPGQTEQEYLSEHLSADGLFFAASQDKLADFSSLFKKMEDYHCHFPEYNWDQYRSVLKDFIENLKIDTFARLNQPIE